MVLAPQERNWSIRSHHRSSSPLSSLFPLLTRILQKPISKPPPLQPLISALQTPREGYFSISDTMNDSELYSRTVVLTIALTDLGDMYLEGGKVMMEGIRNLGGVLNGIEQRIR